MHFFVMGLLLGLSLIMALGPQNLFLIQQSAKRQHHYLAATLCLGCDVILIIGSVMGLSHLVLAMPMLKSVLLVLGVGFLVFYGGLSIRSALQDKDSKKQQREVDGIFKIIILTLSFSLLNPQAIIDTLIMIGANANQLTHEQQMPFMFGVIGSSCLWFYSLSFTASSFSQVLLRDKVFRSIEFCSGLLMLGFAIHLAGGLI